MNNWLYYMMEVQQGNYITNKQVQQLHIGMTKDQVIFLLGKPLTQFMFDQNQWIFFYQSYKNQELKNKCTLTITFDKNNTLSKISKTGTFFEK